MSIIAYFTDANQLLFHRLLCGFDEEGSREVVVSIRELMHCSSGVDTFMVSQCGKLLSELIFTHKKLKIILQGYLDGKIMESSNCHFIILNQF
jgi:hypothetical protein